MLDHSRETTPERRAETPRLRLGGWGWTAVIGALVAFVVVIEIVARINGIVGPIGLLGADLFGRPETGEVKIAGLALALVCMPVRLRWPVGLTALALELCWNLQRLLAGTGIHIGNGVLLALLGATGYALWRLRGRERIATLQAIGLGMLLIVMDRVGATWLVLSSGAHPKVLDDYVEIADRALGSPSWVLGQIVTNSRVLTEVLGTVYVCLPVAAAVIALFQLRNAARDGFPRHHIVRTFLLIGLIGPIVYFVFPVVGPTYAFGHELPGAGWLDVWPEHVPYISEPVATFFAQSVPRNCMPSLHTAWATAIFLHGWRGSRTSRVFGTLWLIGTVSATLGFGYHYAIDVVAGMFFTLTLESALTRPERGWYRGRVLTVAMGAALFTGLLLAVRFGAVQIAHAGVVAPVLILGSVAAIACGYLMIERAPEPAPLAQLPDRRPV